MANETGLFSEREKAVNDICARIFAAIRSVYVPDRNRQYTMGGRLHSYESKVLPPSYLENVFFSSLKDLGRTAKILDIGAGKGEIADFAKTQGYQVVSMDLSSEGLRNLKKKETASQAVIGSGAVLPFPSNSFDFIHAKDMLVHIKDKEAFFVEMLRVLKPGGKILIASATSEGLISGYYFTSAVQIAEAMLACGFDKVKRSKYKPKLNEYAKDWYGISNVIATRYIYEGIKRQSA